MNARSMFFRNSECSESFKESQATDLDGASCRFLSQKRYEDTFKGLMEKHSISTSFFDFDELGNYGLISVEKGSSDEKYHLSAYFNYINKDNYFLKAVGKTKGKAWGNSCIGATFQAIKTEINGNQHPVV